MEDRIEHTSEPARNPDLPKWKVFQPLLLAGVMIFGMLMGFRLYEGIHGKPSFQLKSTGTVQDIINYIESNYVDSVNTASISEKAINQLLSELDPHSTYISPKEFNAVQEDMQGNFEGIGIEFLIVNDTIMVVSPIAGGPSESLGILSGDKIVEIEDSLVAGIGITSEDVFSLLRGKKGTKVKVGIHRSGLDELITYSIKRNKIPLYSVDVSYMLDNNIGYLKINRFSATTYSEFKEHMEKLLEAGMKKLVLDLRQNPGGYLNAATEILDEFLDERKLLVYTQGRARKRQEYKARVPGLFEKGELTVLVDAGSASASEILAGGIQDWDRGTIIGRRSYGKGLVQEQYKLKNGGAFRLTVARYFTPTGRSIQKPYKEGTNSYKEDMKNRRASGELLSRDSIDVSDRPTFTTPSGKTVYGGGGIIPDIFIAQDTAYRDLFTISALTEIPEFSYDYYAKNTSAFNTYESARSYTENFQVNDDLFENYIDFLESKSIKINYPSLNKNSKLIKTRIKAYIARQKWSSEGFYPVVHQIDDVVSKAVEFCKAGTEHQATLLLQE